MGKSNTVLAPVLALSAACWFVAPSAAHAACGGTVNGPCATPDPADYFPGTPGLVVSNFGLLYPGERNGQWQVVCDDNYGLTPPSRIRRAPDGRVFAASNMGLYLSSDGCTWTTAGGAVVNEIVFDVAFDRQRPNRVWALGKIPRVLWLSEDGGATFTQKQAFTDDLTFQRLAVAPSDGNRIYLFGRGRGAMTPAAASTDGGLGFTSFDVAMGSTTPPRIALDFVAIAPDNPAVVYFLVMDPEGDELWKSNDGGRTVARVLRLSEKDAFGGLAFGPAAGTLYVGGYDPFPLGDKPAGRFYVSRDGGARWQPPLPSSPTGPRYRCLASVGNKVYACGAGEPAGDAFMIGTSTDEGKSWQPEVQMVQIYGAKSCVRSRCLTTEVWLCEMYGQCANGPVDAGTPTDAPAAPDGPAGPDGPLATPDAGATGDACVGTACIEEQGCNCRMGGRPGARLPAAGALALAVGVALLVGQGRGRKPQA